MRFSCPLFRCWKSVPVAGCFFLCINPFVTRLFSPRNSAFQEGKTGLFRGVNRGVGRAKPQSWKTCLSGGGRGRQGERTASFKKNGLFSCFCEIFGLHLQRITINKTFVLWEECMVRCGFLAFFILPLFFCFPVRTRWIRSISMCSATRTSPSMSAPTAA